jgi:hypothetical protein
MNLNPKNPLHPETSKTKPTHLNSNGDIDRGDSYKLSKLPGRKWMISSVRFTSLHFPRFVSLRATGGGGNHLGTSMDTALILTRCEYRICVSIRIGSQYVFRWHSTQIRIPIKPKFL